MIKLPFLSSQVQIWLFRTSVDIVLSQSHQTFSIGAKKLLRVLVQSERTLSTIINSISSTRKII